MIVCVCVYVCVLPGAYVSTLRTKRKHTAEIMQTHGPYRARYGTYIEPLCINVCPITVYMLTLKCVYASYTAALLRTYVYASMCVSLQRVFSICSVCDVHTHILAYIVLTHAYMHLSKTFQIRINCFTVTWRHDGLHIYTQAFTLPTKNEFHMHSQNRYQNLVKLMPRAWGCRV
jgi:hypothetical protein